MFVSIYSAFVFSCVLVEALRLADPPSKESYRHCIDEETEKAVKVQQRAVTPVKIILTNLVLVSLIDWPKNFEN
jgi:hypothetical protein